MRLYTYLKNNGNLTKSEVIKLDNENLIKVNGEKKNLSYIIRPGDLVYIGKNKIDSVPFVYYLYNKPVGVICTNDKSVNNNIYERIGINTRIYAIGRLDKDSHGLIILTNDGMFTNSVIGKGNHLEKEYIVKVEKEINQDFINNIMKPVLIKNRLTLENKAYLIDDHTFGIILKEGMYHQIRKIVLLNNNKVIDLKRIRIGNVNISLLEKENKELIKIDNLKDII